MDNPGRIELQRGAASDDRVPGRTAASSAEDRERLMQTMLEVNAQHEVADRPSGSTASQQTPAQATAFSYGTSL